MALIRPQVNSITPFDATRPYTFTFTVNGNGEPVQANTIVIQDNATLDIVYQDTVSTYSFVHTITANTLQNGKTYQATITTKNLNSGAESEPSVPIIFYCLAEPSLTFTNMPDENTVTSNSYQFEVSYNQANNEPLNSAKINLYNSYGALISSSDVINNFDSVPVSFRYLFSGFANGEDYYIECVGTTLHGMPVDSGQISFNVEYSGEEVYSVFELTNYCKGGYVEIKSNIVAIDGEYAIDGIPTEYYKPQYTADGVDLGVDGSSVIYRHGYEINGDFLAKMWTGKPANNSRYFTMSTTDGNRISIWYTNDYYQAEDGYCHAELVVESYGLKYYTESEPVLEPTASQTLFTSLKRVNGLYQIELVVK